MLMLSREARALAAFVLASGHTRTDAACILDELKHLGWALVPVAVAARSDKDE